MTNDSPFNRLAPKPLSIVDETPRHNGASALPGPTGDYTKSDEFARFLQHAKRLEQAGAPLDTLKTWLDLAEAWRITQALRACKGNRSAAARLLGIGRRTLYSKMEKLEITPTWSL